jgi:hypothetical protein
VGASTTRSLALVSPTNHHGQWSGASFKISGKERRFLSQLAKDRKSKANSLTPHYLYHRGNRSSHLEPMPGIVRGVLGTLAFSPQSPTYYEWEPIPHINNINLPGVVRQRSHHAHDFEKSVWPMFFNGVIPTSQWHDTTLRVV